MRRTSLTWTRAKTLALAVGLSVVLSACEESADVEADAEQRVRAIKAYTVSDPAGADIRRYSGTLAASDTSGLAFSVSGTVTAVEIAQGDRVAAGQVLATLDPEPFDLDVQAARSERAAAQAAFAEKQADLDRQQQLFDKGWVTQAAIDQARAAYDTAQAQLDLARSKVGTAERNRGNADLTAPFDGLIAERKIDAFEEVTAGQILFTVNSEGAMEVELSVPDTIVARLALGAPATVDARAVDRCGCTGRVVEIGAASSAGSAVPIKIALGETREGLLPGMSVDVGLTLSGGPEARGFMVPLSAIAAGDETAQGYVFIFDPDTGAVSRVAIQGGDGVDGNFVEVVDGVTAGDIVAAAGVSFLRDGQIVKLMGE